MTGPGWYSHEIWVLGTTALRTSVKCLIAELGMEGVQEKTELISEWITLAGRGAIISLLRDSSYSFPELPKPQDSARIEVR